MMTYHLQIGDRTFCDVTGCVAGQATAAKAGVTACSYPSRQKARDAAKALRPFYCVTVKPVKGECPHLVQGLFK